MSNLYNYIQLKINQCLMAMNLSSQLVENEIERNEAERK